MASTQFIFPTIYLFFCDLVFPLPSLFSILSIFSVPSSSSSPFLTAFLRGTGPRFFFVFASLVGVFLSSSARSVFSSSSSSSEGSSSLVVESLSALMIYSKTFHKNITPPVPGSRYMDSSCLTIALQSPIIEAFSSLTTYAGSVFLTKCGGGTK